MKRRSKKMKMMKRRRKKMKKRKRERGSVKQLLYPESSEGWETVTHKTGKWHASLPLRAKMGKKR